MHPASPSSSNRGPLMITIVVAVVLILCILVTGVGALFYQSSTSSAQITKQAQQIADLNAVLKKHDDLFTALTATAKAPTSTPEQVVFASFHPKVTSLKFYQCDTGTLPVDQRSYQTTFDAASVKYICFELNLSYKKIAERFDYQFIDQWLDANGKQINKVPTDSFFDKDWTSSYHTDGLGSKTGGTFKPGKNTLKLYVDGALIATGTFTVK